MARILRLYVLREIALPTLLALLTITFLLLIGIVYEFISLLLQPNISGWSVAQMLLLLMPGTISFALPMAVLMGALIGVGRMTLDREVLAMRASGINLLRIFAPTLLGALLLSGGILWASGNLVPVLQGRGMNLAAQLQFEMVQSLEPGRFHTDLGAGGENDFALYFRERPAGAAGTMQGVVLKIEDKLGNTEKAVIDRVRRAAGTTTESMKLYGKKFNSPDNMLTMVFAERGEIQTRVSSTEAAAPRRAAAVVLTLSNGTVHRLDPNPEQPDNTVIRFAKLEKRLFTKTDINKPYRTMTNTELWKAVRQEAEKQRAEAAKADPEKKPKKKKVPARSELTERYALSLALFVFMLLAIPLAIWIKPSGKSWGILLAIAVMMVYYVLLKIGSAMVEVGNPLGVMVAFSPNLLFTLLGAGLWWHNLKS